METGPVDNLIRIDNVILNARFIVRITDRGMILAKRHSWGGWTELFGGDDGERVRCVVVSLANDHPDYSGTSYYAEEAEGIWDHFAAIAAPLIMESEPALDSDS